MSNFKCQISKRVKESQQRVRVFGIGNWKLEIRNWKLTRGFTLIELLVSISIMGILMSALIVNIIGFRTRARDTERKKDLLQIQTALELYRADSAAYPASLPNCGSAFQNGAAVYMREIPCDPSTNPAWGEDYTYTLNGNSYELYACMENENDADKDTTKQNGCASAAASYTVESP